MGGFLHFLFIFVQNILKLKQKIAFFVQFDGPSTSGGRPFPRPRSMLQYTRFKICLFDYLYFFPKLTISAKLFFSTNKISESIAMYKIIIFLALSVDIKVKLRAAIFYARCAMPLIWRAADLRDAPVSRVQTLSALYAPKI